MEFFRIKKDIPFMKHALVFNAISFITFALAVFFLFSRGLHLSVEFTGGTVMEVAYSQPAELAKVRETVTGLGYSDVQVQNFGTSRDVMIRLPVQKGISSAQQSEQVIGALKAADPEVTLRRTEFVGPQVGEELVHGGLMALGMVVLGIVVYLALRFEWKFGIAAIIANLHDVVIILGFFAFFQWEFSLSVLAAVLAVLGYSVAVTVFSTFSHANLTLGPRVDGWLGRLLVTPDFHRMHHSAERRFTDSNYGMLLPWWDHLFGTASAPAHGDEARRMQLGLEYFRQPAAQRLDRMLLQPFGHEGFDQARAEGRSAAL